MIDTASERRALSVAAAAAQLRASEREAYVRRACSGDRSLEARVHALLEHAEAPATVFRSPAAPRMSATWRPESIGGCRVVRVVGVGGMGIVFEAEQPVPRRRVAIKALRPGIVSGAALRRFQLEASVLAKLDHPGIAKVHSAGVGREGSLEYPYLILELIEGRWITEHAALAGLSLREKVLLLADVCDAVHHAHQRGVIHRDLKPANVLVDASGRVRIVDFGLARLHEQHEPIPGPRTITGELLGTPAYMSPEQAAGDGLIDIRSDVYAIGATAYELLAGRLPHDIARMPIDQALRRIREVDPPRLGQIDPALRGDLEVIVATAMCTDKEERYASVAELGADLRRYLRQEPISARPAGVWYRAAKLYRRHRWPMTAATAAAAALVGLSVFAVWAAARARSEASDSLSALRMLAELARAGDGWNEVVDAPISERLIRIADRFPGWCPDQPLVEASICEALGGTLAAGTDQARAEAERLLRAALWIRLKNEGPERAATSDAALSLSLVLNRRGLAAEAERLQRAALAALRKREATGAELGHVLHLLARNLAGQGRYDASVAAWDEAIETALQGVGHDHPLVIRCRFGRATSLVRAHRPAEAERELRALLGALDAHTWAPAPIRVRSRRLLAQLALNRGDDAEAVELLERARHDADGIPVESALADSQLAGVLWARDEFQRAEPLFRRAVDTLRKVMPSTNPLLWSAMGGLGVCLRDMERYHEAELLLRESLALRAANLGDAHPDTARASLNLAKLLRATRRPAEAEALAAAALRHLQAALGEGGPDIIEATALVGLLRAEREGFESGRPLLEAALAARRGWTRSNWQAAYAIQAMAEALLAAGREDDALRFVRRQHELLEAESGKNLAAARIRRRLERLLASLQAPERRTGLPVRPAHVAPTFMPLAK